MEMTDEERAAVGHFYVRLAQRVTELEQEVLELRQAIFKLRGIPQIL